MGRYKVLLTVMVLCGSAQLAPADVISMTLGNSGAFTDGQTTSSSSLLIAQGGQPSPFDAALEIVAGGNSYASWTFSEFSIPLGEVVNGASLTIGVVDQQAQASGDKKNGTISFFDSEGNPTISLIDEDFWLQWGEQHEYNEYTIALTGGVLEALAAGAATFVFELGAPVPTGPEEEGVYLLFSTLTIQTAPPVPEPTTLTLAALALLGMSYRRRG